jgi:hydroxyacylglutathione hydrolase
LAEYINDNIFIIRNSIFPSNTYLLKSSLDNSCIVIDPGLDSQAIEAGIIASGLVPKAVIATHGHFDHVGNVAMLKNKYDIPFYLHEADLKISQSVNFYLKVARIDATIITTRPDHLFKGEHDQLTIGNFTLEIHNLPGHSDGSCVVQYGSYLFSGDLLFQQGIGDDSMPKANMELLKNSLFKLITTFKDTDLVLPGHGNAATLEKIKNTNVVLQQFL